MLSWYHCIYLTSKDRLDDQSRDLHIIALFLSVKITILE
jgi:hypothetical protein